MRVSYTRALLLVASVCFTAVFVNVLRYYADDREREKSILEAAPDGHQRRIMAGRVAGISPEADKEFMFMKKTIFEHSETSNSGSLLKANNESGVDVVVIAKQEAADTKASDQNLEKTNSSSPLSHHLHATCHPKQAQHRVENLFGEMFNLNLEPFITEAVLHANDSKKYPLPFGLKGADRAVQKLLEKLPQTGLPESIKYLPCRRCVVVGNGGIMIGSNKGQIIDSNDVIFRINNALVKGFEQDVGSKTTIRLVYPESALLLPHEYALGSTLLVVPFKPVDIEWAEHIVDGKNLSSLRGFWSRIADFVPKSKNEIRLFNPAIIAETASKLIGFKLGTGKMNKNVPTTGAMAITLALRMCDEVSVAGFGYDTSKPNALIHYYNKDKMQIISSSWTHDIKPERKMLLRLVEQGIITDLTNGLQ